MHWWPRWKLRHEHLAKPLKGNARLLAVAASLCHVCSPARISRCLGQPYRVMPRGLYTLSARIVRRTTVPPMEWPSVFPQRADTIHRHRGVPAYREVFQPSLVGLLGGEIDCAALLRACSDQVHVGFPAGSVR